MPAIPPPADKPLIGAPEKPTPTFSPTDVSVIYVLGGPGAGKGTQCANLVRDYGFTHLSAGDLLRAEQERPDSEFGSMIKEYIRDGKIVPMEVTVQLLENAMTEDIKGKGGKGGRFLIDGKHEPCGLYRTSTLPSTVFANLLRRTTPTSTGLFGAPPADETGKPPGFPRKMDQALHFESSVCPSKFTLFFDVPESIMQERLLNRGKTSGRADDNAESIAKRFKTFEDTSMPVVDYFEKMGKVVRVEAVKGPEEVYGEVKRRMAERGFEMVGK